jgi:hypothetical protein
MVDATPQSAADETISALIGGRGCRTVDTAPNYRKLVVESLVFRR